MPGVTAINKRLSSSGRPQGLNHVPEWAETIRSISGAEADVKGPWTRPTIVGVGSGG